MTTLETPNILRTFKSKRSASIAVTKAVKHYESVLAAHGYHSEQTGIARDHMLATDRCAHKQGFYIRNATVNVFKNPAPYLYTGS